MRRLLAALGVTLICTIANAGSFAAQSLGLTVVAWVQSIDDSPDWTARMRGLSVDEAKGDVTIESLVVAAEAGGLAIEIEDAVLSGYRGAANGGLAAASLGIARATIKTTSTEVVLDGSDFDGIGIPPLAGLAYDKSKLFTSLIGAYSALAKMTLSGGRIDTVTFFEKFDDVTSKITYDDVVIGPLADAKIESLGAGPLRVESPAPNSLVELTVARAEAQAIDIDAILHVYDPLRYIAGAGDGNWRRAIGEVAYTDIDMTLPGIGLTLGSVSVEDFKVRQPRESFAPFLDAIMRDRPIPAASMKDLNSRYMAGLLSAYGVGRFSIDGVDLKAVGIDQFSFNRFNVSDASSDGFEEVSIEGFVSAIAGQGAVVIDRFAMGNVVSPPIEALLSALDEIERGVDVDVSALAPQIGSIEAAGIDVRAIDFPGASLDRLRVGLGNYVGSFPTEITFDLDGLDVATSTLPARARGLISSLGYERIETDTDFRIFWNEEDNTLSLDDFRLDIADFGNTTVNVVLAGLTRAAIEESEDPGDFLGDLLFDRASVTFEDKSVVERSLSMRAELLKVPLDRLKQQLAGALPLMLAFVGNPEKVREIVPVLQEFIKTPGTLTITATPDPPVPVAAIEDAVRSRPQSLPGILGISITGAPGQAGGTTPDGVTTESAGPADPSPTIRKTLEPESRPGAAGPTAPSPAEPP